MSGIVKDSSGKGINGVNITYSLPGSTEIRGYAFSTENGSFILKISDKLDSIDVTFGHVGYSKKILHIRNVPGTYSIRLNSKVENLKEVVVTASPIYRQNDTINYNVNAFIEKQDRVVGDVIKKLPGIEMRGDEILYNGKPLMKYYVNGLDMLSGQYNLVNKNLPISAVKKVQIVENDQPIKIFDSLIFSNKASLNIQLKKFTTTGSGKVGGGISPALWDVNLTPMTFNKSLQMLTSIQVNNTGNDVSKQLKNYTSNDLYLFFNDIKENTGPKFTGISSVSTPPFSEERWLDNNIKLINSNILQKFKSGIQLSGNLSYYNDIQRKSSGSITTMYLPTQELTINDDYRGKFATNYLQGKINIEKNEQNIYLTDRLTFSGKWDKNYVDNLRDKNNISQRENTRDISINNIFSSTLFWGKKLISLSSNTSYISTPQNYSVIPGQFSGILNDSIPYSESNQSVNFRNFSTDNNIGLTFGMKRITLNTKLGLSFDRQWLFSNLSRESGINFDLPGNFTKNDIYLTSAKFYFSPSFQYQEKALKIQLDIPLMMNYFTLADQLREKTYFNNRIRPRANPSLFVSYDLNEFWQATASSNYSSAFGDIKQLYGGYILTTFNNLQRKQTNTINELGTFSNTLAFNYKNPIKALFGHFSIAYSRINNNLLYKNGIDSLGYIFVDAVEQNNLQTNFTLSANGSKFFSHLKTTAKLSAAAILLKAPIYVVNNLYPQKSCTYIGRFELNNSSIRFMSFDYHTEFTIIHQYLNNKRLDNVTQNSHFLDLNIFPASNHMFSIMSEYYLNKYKTSNKQYFMNLKYTYSIVKKHLDFEIRCNNVFNSQTYLNISNDAFSITENRFRLRPMQFLASVKFTF